MRALGGFFYVKTDRDTVECRARGVFRNREVSPLVGDFVTIERTGDTTGQVTAIAPRKNELIRPPVANIDQLVLVGSLCDPAPNLLVLDKLLAIAEQKSIEPLLVFTKTDLADAAPYEAIYRQAGFEVLCVCNRTGDGTDAVREHLVGKLSVFVGNSGVGKSSLLNRIDPRLGLETGEISKKLGRGRHTTRHVQLYELPGGGLVADTPGFSTVDVQKYEPILKDQLQYCFREFEPYLLKCRFTGCTHTAEKGCAVRAAVEEGAIGQTRYQNYLALYRDVKDLKEWELR